MNTLLLSLAMLTASSALEAAAAQEVLEAAKTQYAAAAYEDALQTLARAEITAPEGRVEVEQYRALCLIALGRLPEAERAVAGLVDADPTYVPPSDIASPRVLSLISDMRSRELPSAALRLLASGREAFEAKEHARAARAFQLLLEVLDESSDAELPGREDMRMIAQGFVTLAQAVSGSPQPPPQPQRHAEAEAPAQRAAIDKLPPSPAPRPILVPAVVVEQEIPTWIPPDAAAGGRVFKGAIRVRIGADGRVRSAKIEEGTHPAFDMRLLQAAEGWLYEPATRDGVPVESEKVVIVQLNPRP